MPKNALVTGGSRGIGRAVCIELARRGYHVTVNYLSNDEAAADTLRALDGAGELLKFDVSSLEGTEAALQEWQARHPEEYFEALVNNAGIRNDSLLMWMEPEDWQTVLKTNLDSFYHVTRAVLRPMATRKNGRIINIASISGLTGLPGQTNYSAAKGGLIAATKALAKEVAPRNITVNALAPGFIQTDMTEGLDEDALVKTIPAKRFGIPEEVAALVGFLVSKDASYITGAVIPVDGGLSA